MSDNSFAGPSNAPSKGGVLGLVPLIRGSSRFKLGLTLLSGIIAQGGTVASAAIGAWIAGRAVTGASPESLVPGFLVLGVFVVLAAAGRWWQAHISHDFAFSLIENLQLGIYDGLERAAPASILGRRTGELAAVATGDAELMEHFYAHTLADYVGAIIVPVGVLVCLFVIQPLIALTLLPFLALVASVPAWLSRRAGNHGERVIAELGKLNAETVEIIQSQRELAIFGRGADALARVVARTRELGLAQWRYGSRAGIEHAAIDVLTALTVLSATLVGLRLVANQALALALLPPAIVLAAGALAPIAEVTQTARKLGELKAGARRILEIFHQPPQVADSGRDSAPKDTTIRFEGVGFRYGNGLGAILREMDFAIQPGEMVALVGQSGAGKTTTANLLLRFWDATKGRITIGGRDIHDLPIATLRSLIAYVPQDVHLFNQTIGDNIRLGRPSAPQSDVIRAAELAQAHEFISALSLGYDSECGERGARLSGGQRQRIAIARALLTEAPIIVLDEASSNLDGENERAFQVALSRIRRNRTVLVIAHRLSTIRSADRILVLDGGGVAESGSHADLVELNGVYARLIASQDTLQ